MYIILKKLQYCLCNQLQLIFLKNYCLRIIKIITSLLRYNFTILSSWTVLFTSLKRLEARKKVIIIDNLNCIIVQTLVIRDKINKQHIVHNILSYCIKPKTVSKIEKSSLQINNNNVDI